MYLTKKEEKMYNGDEGKAAEDAMRFLVRLGEAYDAERMVDITYAHAHSGLVEYKDDVKIIEDLAKAGAQVRVPTSTVIINMDMERWRQMGVPERLAKEQLKVLGAHRQMGSTCTLTCTPELTGYSPTKGSHISCIESSAINYFNSVVGARVNRDGWIVPNYAAITGKYPLYGYHLDENRVGTHLVRVNARLDDATDFSALGFYLGGIVGAGVPVFEGLKVFAWEELKALSAGLATSGAVALYHIPGVTAEARSVEEAFGGEIPKEVISVGNREIEEAYESLRTVGSKNVDFVGLGCPQYSLEQIRKVAQLLRGRKIHPGVDLWVFTPRTIKAAADTSGYTDAIEGAGGLVVCDTCPLHFILFPRTGVEVPERREIETMVLDSTKQSKYVREAIGCDVVFAKTKECVKAAITGVWK